MGTVYDPEEDDYILVPKTGSKIGLKTRAKPQTKTGSKIELETRAKPQTKTGSKIELETRAKPQRGFALGPPTVVQCCVCGQNFKNDIGLQTQMNIHWSENIAQDNNFNIQSSFNQRQLYITTPDDLCIKDIT